MNVQIGIAILGNALLVGMAVLEIFVARPAQPEWAMQAGLPLGWCALLLTAGAGAYRRLQIRRHWDPRFVGLAGMGVLALLACTVPNIVLPDGTKLDGTWAYRVLMLGWSIYALLVALAAWWVSALRTQPDSHGPPQALLRLAAVWVRVAGIAAVILGIKAAFIHDDVDYERLWAAAAIAIASTAGATMAVWRRREGWAFTAALGFNFAASLAVWHFEEALNLSFDQWWVRLVQANVIASSLAALFWLAAHKRLYALKQWNLADSPVAGSANGIAGAGQCGDPCPARILFARSSPRIAAVDARFFRPAGLAGPDALRSGGGVVFVSNPRGKPFARSGRSNIGGRGIDRLHGIRRRYSVKWPMAGISSAVYCLGRCGVFYLGRCIRVKKRASAGKGRSQTRFTHRDSGAGFSQTSCRIMGDGPGVYCHAWGGALLP